MQDPPALCRKIQSWQVPTRGRCCAPLQPIVSVLGFIREDYVLTGKSGGMGLTGGFADVGGLYDCLNAIYSGKSDDGILDKYDEVRRDKYWSIIDPISRRNLNRLMNDSPEAIRDDEFFNLLKKAEADQSGNMNRDMALVRSEPRASVFCYGMLT